MKKWHTAIILFAVIADRFVKAWATAALKPIPTLPLWEGVFHLTYVENMGAAFGMLQGQRIFFFIVTILLSLALIWILYFRPLANKGCNVGLAMLFGGALGNFYDRMVHGFVVDMFDFRLINFAVFNVADMMICVGAAVFLLWYIIDDVKRTRAQKQAGSEGGGEAESL